MNKKMTIFGVIVLGLAVMSIFFINQNKGGSGENIESRKISIAVCPTYYSLADSLDKTEYKIIKTGSSSESLGLLRNNRVEYALSGRPLKPDEGTFQREFIAKNGYSFVGQQEQTINKNNLSDEILCTDLNKIQIEAELGIENIRQMKDASSCPANGIIITSWDKTDYSKSEIIHIVNDDGSRYLLSRTPILYCHDICSQNIINQVKKHL